MPFWNWNRFGYFVIRKYGKQLSGHKAIISDITEL